MKKADYLKTGATIQLVKIKNSKAWKRIKKAIHFILNFSELVAIVLAILAFQNINNLNDVINAVKSKPDSHAAIVEWQKELENLRVGYCRDYIEDIIGSPQMLENVNCNESVYTKATYVNSYYSLFCVYRDDSSLIGFLIIGNNKKFNMSNYRCRFTLFDYSINEAENYCFNNGAHSIRFLNNYNGNRLDTNSYYFECNMQHGMGAVESYLIGYGICDIGDISLCENFYETAQQMYIIRKSDESVLESYDNTKYDAIRDCPINSFLVMKDTKDAVELISSCLVRSSCLGMSRSSYANYQDDYQTCINTFLQNFSITKQQTDE